MSGTIVIISTHAAGILKFDTCIYTSACDEHAYTQLIESCQLQCIRIHAAEATTEWYVHTSDGQNVSTAV